MKTPAREAYELAAEAQKEMTDSAIRKAAGGGRTTVYDAWVMENQKLIDTWIDSAIRKAASEGRTGIYSAWIRENQKLIDTLIDAGYVVDVQECMISWGHVKTDAMADSARCPSPHAVANRSK